MILDNEELSRIKDRVSQKFFDVNFEDLLDCFQDNDSIHKVVNETIKQVVAANEAQFEKEREENAVGFAQWLVDNQFDLEFKKGTTMPLSTHYALYQKETSDKENNK